MEWFSGVLMARLLENGASFSDMTGLALLLGSFSAMIAAAFSLLAPSSHPRDSLKPQLITLLVVVPLLAVTAGLMTVLMLFGTFIVLNMMLFYLNHGFRWN